MTTATQSGIKYLNAPGKAYRLGFSRYLQLGGTTFHTFGTASNVTVYTTGSSNSDISVTWLDHSSAPVLPPSYAPDAYKLTNNALESWAEWRNTEAYWNDLPNDTVVCMGMVEDNLGALSNLTAGVVGHTYIAEAPTGGMIFQLKLTSEHTAFRTDVAAADILVQDQWGEPGAFGTSPVFGVCSIQELNEI